jgi:hypothetical protein
MSKVALGIKALGTAAQVSPAQIQIAGEDSCQNKLVRSEPGPIKKPINVSTVVQNATPPSSCGFCYLLCFLYSPAVLRPSSLSVSLHKYLRTVVSFPAHMLKTSERETPR